MMDIITNFITKGNIEAAAILGLVAIMYFLIKHFTDKSKLDKTLVEQVQAQHTLITTNYDTKLNTFKEEIEKIHKKVDELKEILKEKEKDEFYRNEKLDEVLDETCETTEEIREGLKDLSHRIDLLIVQIDPTKTIKIDRGLPL